MNHGVDQLCRTCTTARINLARAKSVLFHHKRFASTQTSRGRSLLDGSATKVHHSITQKQYLSTSNELQQSAPDPATRPTTTPESEHWSNVNAEISILKPNPPTALRARFQQWQIDYGRQGLDEPNVFSHLREDGYVRPDVSKILEMDETIQEDGQSPENLQGLEFPDDDIYKPEYNPGDVCDLQATGGRQPLLAVLLARIGRQYQFYTIKGQLLHVSATNHFGFHTSGLVPREELEPMLPFIPTGEVLDEFLQVFRDVHAAVPRNVSIPVLRRLRDFQRRSDDLYREFSQNVDNAHELVADPKNLIHLPAEQIASRIFGAAVVNNPETKPVAMYTLSWAVFKRVVGFEANDWVAPHGELVVVDSLETVARIGRVIHWVRVYQEKQALLAAHRPVPKAIAEDAKVLHRFIEKVKGLILRSRATRLQVPGWGVGPSKRTLGQRVTEPETGTLGAEPVNLSSSPLESKQAHFTKDEKDIIFFLLMECCTGYFKHQKRTDFVKTLIIRLTEAYKEVPLGLSLADRQFVWDLLTEIGIVEPWTLSFDATRYMPAYPEAHEHQLDLMTRKVEVEGVDAVMAGKFHDKFESLRRDWGNLPVYCIDSESTMDLDDGISIERIPGTTDEVWLHVHVAHPTAFFSSRHPIGRKALYSGVSMYMPQGREPILPQWVTKHFSLAPNKPVLTYSARVNRNGEILESQIQPGTIRNVLSFSLEAVHRALGHPAHEPPTMYQMGEAHRLENESEMARILHDPNKQHRADLKEMLTFCIGFEKKSRGAWSNEADYLGVAQHIKMPEGGKPFYGSPRLDQETPATTQADPAMQLKKPRQDERRRELAPEKQLVEQCMIIAGTVAAAYCQQRKIPVVYQGTREAFENPDLKMLTERSARLEKIGLPRLAKGLISEMLSRKVYSSRPVEHKLMQLPAYTQATSPLRRSRDLITTWQIDASLRYELRPEESSGSTTSTWPDKPPPRQIPSNLLPFSRRFLEQSAIVWSTIRERYRYQLDRISRKHWLVQMLFRAHRFGEGAGLIPSPLRITISDSVRDVLQGLSGQLHGLSIKAMMVQWDLSAYRGEEQPRPTVERGDVWEVEIIRISTHYRRVWVRPVQLVEKGEAVAQREMTGSDEH